jgi:predicted transcriptional regulator
VKRTQIYLDDEQDRRLSQRAAVTRCTKSQLIRQAIDVLLEQPTTEDVRLAEFRAAVLAAAGTAPSHLDDDVQDLREAGRQKAEELELRWHCDEPDDA